MRIVSANLNQRVGNAQARARLESWLREQAATLFLAQEPFVPTRIDRPPLEGYTLLSSSQMVSCWLAGGHPEPIVVEHDERWHEIAWENLSVHNVYLSPYSSKDRREMLVALKTAIGGRQRRNAIVLGDFNLAPRLADGVFGEEPSKFTTAAERSALGQLLRSARLVDSTCPPPDREPEFTFERTQNGRPLRFRCDLALVSEGLCDSAEISYDHSVRFVGSGFTDHSAIVVEVRRGDAERETSSGAASEQVKIECSPAERASTTACSSASSFKTAIRRREASQIARELRDQGVLDRLGIRSILDFGCGYGADVQFYRGCGYEADGFDIEPSFGWSKGKDRQYDLVTAVFVVNVLPTVEDRLQAVRTASQYVRPGGFLLVAARSEKAISIEARKGKWTKFNDGWVSSPQRGTFQRGVPTEEIAWLLGAIGFSLVQQEFRLSSDVSWLLGRHRRSSL